MPGPVEREVFSGSLPAALYKGCGVIRGFRNYFIVYCLLGTPSRSAIGWQHFEGSVIPIVLARYIRKLELVMF